MQVLLLAFFLLLPHINHAEYLGEFSAKELNQNAILNDSGAHGPLSSTSPRNPIGIYGSPTNPYGHGWRIEGR